MLVNHRRRFGFGAALVEPSQIQCSTHAVAISVSGARHHRVRVTNRVALNVASLRMLKSQQI